MHDYDDDLDGFLLENEEGRTYDPDVLNDADAEFALSMLRKAHQEIERIERAAERQMERLKVWQEQASAAPLEDVAKWEAKLIAYRKKLEFDDPDLKVTYTLPSGVIKRTAGRERIVVEDELAFYQWALDNDTSLIRMSAAKDEFKRKPNLQPLTARDALKKTARDSPTGAQSQLIDMSTGEKVPGVKIEVGPTTYSAKPT